MRETPSKSITLNGKVLNSKAAGNSSHAAARLSI